MTGPTGTAGSTSGYHPPPKRPVEPPAEYPWTPLVLVAALLPGGAMLLAFYLGASEASPWPLSAFAVGWAVSQVLINYDTRLMKRHYENEDALRRLRDFDGKQ